MSGKSYGVSISVYESQGGTQLGLRQNFGRPENVFGISAENSIDECKYNRSYQPFLEYLRSLGSQEHSNCKDFLTYVSMKAEMDSNWKFWKEFVLRDVYSYVCLFLAIRGGEWKLRTASIKMMAPLFTAFDRPHYRKILPQHLRDLHHGRSRRSGRSGFGVHVFGIAHAQKYT